MQTERPPTIDPIAAQAWVQTTPVQPPWLHEEVARRMEERLQWIVKKPADWLHWSPLSGGMAVQERLVQRYPQAQCYIHEPTEARQQAAKARLAPRWWQAARWNGRQLSFEAPGAPVEMLWANMALHMDPDPQALIAQWHSLVSVDGFLMFSCLGPDTLRELHSLYQACGWPAPSHAFTDMHDWGDMLVRSGFAEPVMDMERITLSYSGPESMLKELRELGRNLHRQRFPALRGRAWAQRLRNEMADRLVGAHEPGRLQISFEIIYGHAFKPAARLAVAQSSQISLDDMRQALGLGRPRQSKTPQQHSGPGGG